MAAKNFAFWDIPKITDLAVEGIAGGSLEEGKTYYFAIKGTASSHVSSKAGIQYSVYEGPISNIVLFTPDAVNKTARLTWTPIPGNDAILYAPGVKCWLTYQIAWCSDGEFGDFGVYRWTNPAPGRTAFFYDVYLDGLVGTKDVLGTEGLVRGSFNANSHGLLVVDGGDDGDPITWEEIWEYCYDNALTEKDRADWIVTQPNYTCRVLEIVFEKGSLMFRCNVMFGNKDYDTCVFKDRGKDIHVAGSIFYAGDGDVKFTVGLQNGTDDDGDYYGIRGGSIRTSDKPYNYSGFGALTYSFARGGPEVHAYGFTWHCLRGGWPSFWYGQAFAISEFYDCTIAGSRNVKPINAAGTSARFVRVIINEEQGGFLINGNWSAYTKDVTIYADTWPMWVNRQAVGDEDWFYDVRGLGAKGAAASWDGYMVSNYVGQCVRLRAYDMTAVHDYPDPAWYWHVLKASYPGVFVKVWQYVSIKLTVRDAVGVALQDATVTCYDKDGNVDWTETTDVNGTFTKQDTLRKYWHVTDGFAGVIDEGTITPYTPHVVTISKDGYRTYTGTYDLIYAVDDEVALEIFTAESEISATLAEAPLKATLGDGSLDATLSSVSLTATLTEDG